MKILEAKGLISWFLYKFNYGGITMPWKTIYIRKDLINEEKLINHEIVHVDQIDRLGWFNWLLKYFYYQIRYGYKNNPLEIEARKKSGWI